MHSGHLVLGGMGRGVGRGEGGGVRTVLRDKVYTCGQSSWTVCMCVWLRYRNISESCPQQRRGRTREVARTGFCLVPGLKCHGFGYQQYSIQYVGDIRYVKLRKVCDYTATVIPFIYSFSGNNATSAPISTFMCLWAIYIFPGSAYIFPPAEQADPSWEYIIR
jgi:hypothetical protein